MKTVPAGHAPPDPDFATVWRRAETIPGWLTPAQARRLWSEASALVPGSAVVEIGSHRGRSTVVLGSAVAGRGTVFAVDPFVDGKLFGGDATRLEFTTAIADAGLDDVVELVVDYSTRIRRAWDKPFDLLYVDGKHDYWSCTDDVRWGRHLPDGGAMLMHDAFSSLGVTASILVNLLPSKSFAFEGRVGSLATFRRRRPTAADRWRLLVQLPWWLRNLVVKVLLRVHARRAAELLGHRGLYDPY
jgi:Methyltransferase domain